MAKDCAAQIAKESPQAKLVGPFALATYDNPLSKWVAEGRVMSVAAPSNAPGFMGQRVRRYKGCTYDIRDGKPVFREMIDQTKLPLRQRLPGEE
jgi:hypothetical protein